MAAVPATSIHGPSAPPANMFDTVPGYEGTIAGGGGKDHASYIKHQKYSIKHFSVRECVQAHMVHLNCVIKIIFTI